MAKLNGEVMARPKDHWSLMRTALAEAGITPSETGLKAVGSPLIGRVTPPWVMVEPLSLTRASTKMGVRLPSSSDWPMPAMEAGLYHIDSAPMSAASPEKARPEALVDWSSR